MKNLWMNIQVSSDGIYWPCMLSSGEASRILGVGIQDCVVTYNAVTFTYSRSRDVRTHADDWYSTMMLRSSPQLKSSLARCSYNRLKSKCKLFNRNQCIRLLCHYRVWCNGLHWHNMKTLWINISGLNNWYLYMIIPRAASRTSE